MSLKVGNDLSRSKLLLNHLLNLYDPLLEYMSNNMYINFTDVDELSVIDVESVIVEAEIVPDSPKLFPCAVDDSWQAAAERFNKRVKERRRRL